MVSRAIASNSVFFE